MKKLLPALFTVLCAAALAQTNMISTNPLAEQIMLGSYNPATYQASTVLNHPDTISRGINVRVNPDSLHAYLEALRLFKNRNTGSDTVSSVKGVGAARRWVYSKFQQLSAANENRLIPSYLQFDLAICSIPQHRDIYAVLPGMDTTDKSVLIIEGHMDSRCEGLCDTACLAEGMEDNGSGTALVLELARVMSKYSYNHTLVFLVTVGEEQGLYGAYAFANYCNQKGIQILCVQNNDIDGGIICGATSSPPSCPGLNNIDSTHMRIFSYGGFNSAHKQFARFCKLEYKEQLLAYNLCAVPMLINIMTPEDRTGRSGDHIPFRQKNYTTSRLMSENEHGNANVSNINYTDRQHSTRDILGADTNNDGQPDSFYVDFHYLTRNTVINGNAMGMAGIGPKKPDLTAVYIGGTKVVITITQQTQYQKYRIAVRTTTNDWDTVYTFVNALTDTLDVINPGTYIFSTASVDTKNVESLFSKEIQVVVTSVNELTKDNGIMLLQNKPNPFDEATGISVLVNTPVKYREAYVSIKDISGKEIQKLPITLTSGMNEVNYEHGYHATGTFTYTLVIDGKPVQSKTMVFEN